MLGREPCGDRILRSCLQKAPATARSNHGSNGWGGGARGSVLAAYVVNTSESTHIICSARATLGSLLIATHQKLSRLKATPALVNEWGIVLPYCRVHQDYTHS